jgi:uncharacterized protein YaaQ
MKPPTPDRLLILTVSGSQSDVLIKKLSQAKFHFTMIDSRGSMFQGSMSCLLIGFNEKQQRVLFEMIRNNCRPYRQYIPTQGPLPGELAGLPMMEAQLGGALVYMMNVERFEQF